MALGVLILASAKGDIRHRRRGRAFLAFMSVVIATAALGAIFFRAAPTLVAITGLVAYLVVSGLRAGSGMAPGAVDLLLGVVALASGLAFLVYLLSGASPFWRPQTTIPTAVTLMVVACYDLARLAFPAWRSRIYPLEHGLKMMMAFAGLVSAAFGTLAPAWQPWSQIGPSVVMSIVAVAYVLLRGRAALGLRRAQMST